MKKLPWILGFIIIFNQIVFATPPEFSGGINNEYEYKEVVFLSGEPIVFKGEFKETVKEDEEEKKVTYRFTLEPEDSTIDGRLTRSVTIVTTYTPKTDKGQTIADTVVDKYTETIRIEDDTYRLEDIQFSQSNIIDNRPASDFYSGNIKARKYYSINNDEGTVIIDITGGDVGYENFWGSTETQKIDYIYKVDRSEDGEDNNLSWEGTVQVQVSDSTTKTLKYSDNEANFSSFNGGYTRISNREMVSTYSYNLPTKTDEGLDTSIRNKDSISLKLSMNPNIERLIVPKFRDTVGHWAQSDIEKLYSLDVFEGSETFFIPDTYMTRMDFVKAVVKACNIRVEEEETTNRTSRRSKEEVEEIIFVDVASSDPDFQYVKDAYNKNIITGDADYKFRPDGKLTRAEAITILIRALGFENKAPAPGYQTSYDDDEEIPNWARDAIYMATEIGIVGGDEYNRINANKIMTRAEASAMIVRFLNFLEKDLQKDYRENIIYY
ncbi:S-layer homology domain-containing protein [Defluviitalea phaphyphila]|uniref:S-layer homology domain-containing protein n=1 Tax=Defluviitalea phaphyphila TaxID=1473580 RepID=UPI00072FE984|nr:S-layer homology domain-containing protein [Defluviitalea phaphyphila]